MRYINLLVLVLAFSAFGQLYANDNPDFDIYIDTSTILMLSIIIGIIAGIIITIIAVKAQMKKHRPVKIATHADLYVRPENVRMQTRTDTFLRRHEVRLKSINTQTTGMNKMPRIKNTSSRSSTNRSRR